MGLLYGEQRDSVISYTWAYFLPTSVFFFFFFLKRGRWSLFSSGLPEIWWWKGLLSQFTSDSKKFFRLNLRQIKTAWQLIITGTLDSSWAEPKKHRELLLPKWPPSLGLEPRQGQRGLWKLTKERTWPRDTVTHKFTRWYVIRFQGFPGGSVVKTLLPNAGDPALIPGSGRPSEEGNGNPLQYSWLGNPMDRESWQATVHGVANESDAT